MAQSVLIRNNIYFKIFCWVLLAAFVFPSNGSSQVNNRWSAGFGGGIITGNIPTGSAAANIVSDRFQIHENFYPSLRLHAGYNLTEFESLELNFSTGSFSVFTDYEFWPDLLFENRFYTGSLETRFRLSRLFTSMPELFDLHGVFGLGIMQSNHKVAPFSTTGTSQIDFENDQTNELSLLFSFGLGLDLPISERISLFLQYDYKTMNKDLIDRDLASEILLNDFVQTTNNWSAFSTGVRLQFGKTRSDLPPAQRDFEHTAALADGTVQPMNDSTIEQDPVIEPEPIIISRTIPAVVTEETDQESDSPDSEPEQGEEDHLEEAEIEEADPDLMTVTDAPDEQADETVTDVIAGEIESKEEQDPISDVELRVFHPEPEASFGLFGRFQESLSARFTIIIHSFTQRELAESSVKNLQNDGLRAFIQPVMVNQTNYYRVAIGQFESRVQAMDAGSELPESYRNNFFLSPFE